MMKVCFGMIIFEGDYVLKECLQSVYPYASQILIAEGPVKYWQDQGYTTSKDRTNEILDNFPDPDHKLKIVHGQFNEKDDQCNAYMKHMNADTDYLWNLDSDEVYKSEDIEKIISLLEKEKYTSIGVKSCSFYGGFDRYMSGFEENNDNFLRIFKVTPGCTWQTHRPPTIKYPEGIEKKHLCSDDSYNLHGVKMYHYSYVFPKQVYKKLNYYKSAVSKSRCIDNYFFNIYLPWVLGDDKKKNDIENTYQGVHEFLPQLRGPCYTKFFLDEHPKAIKDNLNKLKENFNNQLQHVLNKIGVK